MPPVTSPTRALAAILPLIASGQAYEAHQKARTFASRYVKSESYDQAIEVLFQSARELLKAGQQGSGTDLGSFLVDVYIAKEQKVDEDSRGRLTQLIALTGPYGAWRKTLIDKSVAWSSQFGWCPAGDPDLHHYIGELLYKEGAFDQAEPHLLASGERDSARLFAKMMFEWSKDGSNPSLYASRGVIPYLLVHNILAARAFLSEFLSLLIIAKPSVVPEAPPRSFTLGDSDEIVVTTDTGLNFLQLLIRVCQRASPGSGGVTGARNAWDRFMRRYQNKGGIFGTEQFKQAMSSIAQHDFGFPPPRGQGANPFGDMISSLFGAPGASSSPTNRGPVKGREKVLTLD